jgi:hypothetical protein
MIVGTIQPGCGARIVEENGGNGVKPTPEGQSWVSLSGKDGKSMISPKFGK